MSGSEARRHPRVRPDPSAPVRVDVMGNGFLEVLRARDVSVGGLSVRVRQDFAGYATNSEVELIVTLGKARPFKARGVVRHRSGDGNLDVFGIEFVGLSAEQYSALEAYVDAQLAASATR